MQYVSPDDWKDETVEAKNYLIGQDGSVSGVRMVGLDLDDFWKDRHGPRRHLRGVYAERESGRRLYFPEQDHGRNLTAKALPGHALMHRHPLTPTEELATPWVSVYGHAPGEGYGMNFCLIHPFPVRPDDVRCVLGRFEAHRAERVIDFLEPAASDGVRTFLRWLIAPEHDSSSLPYDEELRAQWFTYGAPAVLWCCSPAEADALWRATALMLSDEMVTAFAARKEPEGDVRHLSPRRLMAQHLLDVTQKGEAGHYLGAVALRALGGEGNLLGFQLALARPGHHGLVDSEEFTMEAAAKKLKLTDDDLRGLAEAERTLGLA